MDLVDAGRRRRWWMSAAAVLLLVAAAAAVAVIWWQRRDEPVPEDAAREFLTARTCQGLRALADGDAQKRLGNGSSECKALTDTAKGRRTYTDGNITSGLERDLAVHDAVVDGDRAQVLVTVHFSAPDRRLEEETMGVVLVHRGDRWLVDDWGPQEPAQE